MDKHGNAEIAYILKGFPRLSETFIANEIYVLEQLGIRLRLYSIKRGETGPVQPVVGRIRAPLKTLPRVPSVSGCPLTLWLARNLPRFASAHLRLLKRRPRAYLLTLRRAVAMAWRYRPRAFSLRKSIVKEFLQAGHIACDLLGQPSVRHLHGHFCHGATTVTWFVSDLTGLPFSFTAHAKDIYQQQLNPGDLLQRKLNAARFVATCTGANEDHLRRLAAENAKVRKVYHGLDTRLFAPLARPADPDQLPLLLGVGRFVEKKGFIYLVEACALLAAKNLAFRCLIVGEPGDQLERVENRVNALGLTGQVTLQQAVTQDALKAIYARATLFVLPCLVVDDGDRDGIPNVLAEAMAMALPVVTTPISGIPELVEDGNNGLLVSERDSESLAHALERLLGDPPLRARLGRSARKTVCRDFDSWQTTRALRELFVDLLQTEKVGDQLARIKRVAA